ncbi:MAG: PAS domain-containing protein, partial [Cyanobacteria bacterium J06639_1]
GSIASLTRHAPELPIVVLTNTDDAELSVEAVRLGAQDYLVKRQVTSTVLLRSLRYAIERKRISEALQDANNALERKVGDRTAELEAANRSLHREVLARQIAQERLAVAQRAGGIGTFEWNLQTDEVLWSPELEALYGVPPGQLGRSYHAWLQTICPGDRESLARILQNAIQSERTLDVEARERGG